MEKEKLEAAYAEGTKRKESTVNAENVEEALIHPENEKQFQDAVGYKQAHPENFKGLIGKIQRELLDIDMEMVQNFNIIAASFQQISLIPHAQASIEHLHKRKLELLGMIEKIQIQMTINKKWKTPIEKEDE